MNPSLKTSHLGSALLIVAVTGALLSVAGTPLRPGNLLCVNNTIKLSQGIAEYAQDNDEYYPRMDSLPALKADLQPFVSDPTAYICPVTGANYQPNAALSKTSVLSHGSASWDLETFRDGQPHADGLATVVYADGHIEHGGVDQVNPEQASLNDARRLALSILQYAQDSDEVYPPMRTQAEMQKSIAPYVGDSRLFRSPITGHLYVPNPAVSGKGLVDLPQPSAVELLRDPLRHRDGKYIVAYADGHVVRQ